MTRNVWRPGRIGGMLLALWLVIAPSSVSADFWGKMADKAKKTGGDVSDTTKKAGKDVSNTTKKAGKDISNTTKKAGKDIHKEAGKAADWAKKEGGMASKYAKVQGGKSSDWWKEHVNKPVGKPWNRAIRDPWVRYLNRIFSTGQDKLDKAADRTQTGITDGISRTPYPMAGNEYEYSNVPQGKVTKSADGLLIVVAPRGGVVGFEMPMATEGRKVEITMFVLVEKGRVNLALGRDDGRVMATSSDPGKIVTAIPDDVKKAAGVQGEVHQLTFVTVVPTDGKGYGHTDSTHRYRALLQLSAGARVQVVGGETHAIAGYSPDARRQ